MLMLDLSRKGKLGRHALGPRRRRRGVDHEAVKYE